MCNDGTFADMDARARPFDEMTRRQFSSLSAGIGLSILLPRSSQAVEVEGGDVRVETPEGEADGYFVHPSGAAGAAHPGVLIWPDAFGLRPAMRQMARRLAESGYAVLVVNPYYRTARAPILTGEIDFANPDTRKTIMSMMATLTPETQVTDARAFVDFLDAQLAVATDRKLGTMGYCMGGPITMRTAATRPDRIGAGASFHGGGLVKDDPDSPHLLVPRIKAHYLFAIAENDDQAQPEAKDVLRDTFEKSGQPAEIEVYEGAMHGWCPPDSPVYHQAQAERAWARLLALLDRALG